ncbi:MAG: polyprenyl synthetase family protein [Candidatus Thorarchaeota archaeon]|nr:MAG: polyprenyl synthetase family protein [Candidatus Thorarchaeota archaeon]
MGERHANVDIVGTSSDESRHQELHRRLVAIEERIDLVFEAERGEPEVLYETAKHILQAGGKRIRSLLATLCCEAVGGTFEEALPFAVATEFVQTASLIHDDVIDEDDTRRGVDSTHKKYGNRMAIIAGDLLIAQAVKLVSKFSSPELMYLVADAGVKMCEGEASDILMYFTTPKFLTEESYFDIVRRKTVSFMRAATKIGGMVGKASDEQLEILDTFGEQIGYAFQIRDDILDVIASSTVTGKTVHSDLKGSKTNYLLIHALSLCTESEASRCMDLLNDGNIEFALQLIEKTDAVKHASDLAQEYAEKAKEVITNKGFMNEYLLCALADLAGDRDF